MRHVKEEQGSEQAQGPLDTIYWTFAPGIRLFNVCRAKTGAWDNARNCAVTAGHGSKDARRPGANGMGRIIGGQLWP
eukprot:3621198-Lingulodinium_polyedra.AAC.1